MKKKIRAAGFLSAAILASWAMAAQDRPLAELYKTGRLKLVEEVRISDKAFPSDIFFQNPRGIAVDAAGRVYVADSDANHLKVFGPDGKFLRTIGRKGQGPGEFLGPEFVEVGGGRIYIWESMSRRISILDAEGKFIASIPFYPGVFGILIRMRALPDGRLVAYYERGFAPGSQIGVPDTQDRVVELLSAEAKPLRTLYEKKVRASRLALNKETNSYVRVPFPYHPGVAMEVTPAGIIAVGGNDNYGFELLGPDKGRLASVVRSFAALKLSEKDKQAHFGRFRMTVFKDNIKTILPKPPPVIVKFTEFPDTLPPYRDFVADGEGNLWVHIYVESRAANVFDVFSQKGEFLGRITVDGAPIDESFASSASVRFAGRSLWEIERDKEGYPSLVKYRLTNGK